MKDKPLNSGSLQGDGREVRVLTVDERQDFIRVIEAAQDLLDEDPGLTARLIELKSILGETSVGQTAISASLATLKKFHEPGIPEAILMPMALGIALGIRIERTGAAERKPKTPKGRK